MRTSLCLALCTCLAACSGDEREPVGGADPSVSYCIDLEYRYDDGRCTFPDGSSCAVDDFYESSCGQAFSYCETHGGTLSSASDDASTKPECTTPDGATCSEIDYFYSHACK